MSRDSTISLDKYSEKLDYEGKQYNEVKAWIPTFWLS